MNPDYDKWASSLLEEIYYAPEDHRISILKENLLMAAKRGYKDGSDNAWMHSQEAHAKTHSYPMCTCSRCYGDVK